ncbi:MobH family relaxase [Neisseria weixii]|uniref:MobH family relaxase n=1 Tax=Neisseria weixii TaxID=1853276 RepID=UPI00360B89B1
MLLETLLLGSLSAGALSAIYLLKHKSDTSADDDLPKTDMPCISGDRFLVLNADQLVRTLDLSPLLANIKNNLGLSNENWQKDALPFLYQYIEFVQRLPASESHHHAGDGGLVKHTLDVACLALIASTSQSWPPNAKTEDIAKKTAVWRYGIMCAAILHDVGKTITGFSIELYADTVTHEHTLWLPDAGSMTDSDQAYYRVTFPDARSAYRAHTEIAWTFFQSLVPAHVRRWIAKTDPSLMIELRNYLSGQKDGSPLQEVITRADMVSVSRDLKSGSRQRFTSAKRTPLIETVMETLREMLSDRGAHFSIATTAGGDLFRQGDFIYMMAKNVPDFVRQYLRNHRHPAAPSFPSDNQRIFDTLYEYGAIVPASDPFRAVSNIEVNFTRNDGERISANFSVLCFKATTLYPDGTFPEEFKGSLQVITGKPATLPVIEQPVPDVHKTSDLQDDAKQKAKVDFLAHEDTVVGIDGLLSKFNLITEEEADSVIEQGGTATESLPSNSESRRPEILKTDIPLQSEVVGGKIQNQNKSANTEPKNRKPVGKSNKTLLTQIFAEVFDEEKPPSSPKNQKKQPIEKLTQADTAQTGLQEIIRERQSAPESSPRPVKIAPDPTLEDVQSGLKEITILESSMAEQQLKAEAENEEQIIPAIEEKKVEARQRGIQFIHWLGNELADGSISTNQSGSPVHFIEHGMLLVSPVIFRDYAGGVFNKSDTESFGPMAQKGFESLRLHKRSKRTALFRAIANNGSNKRLFYCYLIPEHNIKHIIQPSSRPANNTNIALENDADLLNLEQE